MEETPFARMALLFGAERMARLAGCHVLIFGVGGVGGHCAEALARCGIGRFTLVDGDTVAPSNLNRQAVALHSTLGRAKVDVMRGRMLDVNPQAAVRAVQGFYLPGSDLGLWDTPYDLVIDAVDTVAAKVDIALRAERLGIPCVSSMGAGNKLDPTRFEVCDLHETSVCPLCRATRRLAREKGVGRLRVVYSKEAPVAHANEAGGRVPGSVAYVTATAGLIVASEAVRLLLAGDLPA